VILTTPNRNNFPNTSPVFLEIHATCAKVASFSAASDYINEFLINVGKLDLPEDTGDIAPNYVIVIHSSRSACVMGLFSTSGLVDLSISLTGAHRNTVIHSSKLVV